MQQNPLQNLQHFRYCRISPHFMELNISVPLSQQVASGPRSESEESRTQLLSCFFKHDFHITPSKSRSSNCSFFLYFPQKKCTYYVLSHLILLVYTYLLTPWCRVLLEKLTGLQLVKKFPAFHGTRRFITALTRFRHISLSWAHPIQSIYPHPTSWRSILILSTHTPRPPQWSLSLRLPHQDSTHTPLLTHSRHMPSPSHSSRFFLFIAEQN